MNEGIEVHIELEGRMLLVGRLWTRAQKGRESASFEYAKDWLTTPSRFALEPALTLDPGAHHTRVGHGLFGAIGDSAPDRWGRMLLQRMERKTAEREGRSPHALLEADYLLGVDDGIRLGALRFKRPGETVFLAHSTRKIPPLVFLPKLLGASDRVIEDRDSEEDLRLLLAPGSSLGGARPKAVMADAKGNLWLAKFPHKEDEYDVQSWSYLVLKLAEMAGISVPPCQRVPAKRRTVLLVSRFERLGTARLPFLSAMSMLGAADGETHSYLEIVDSLRRYGAQPEKDQRELWRRVLFNVLVSNVDDHLRNHGFLYDSVHRGWRLAPAYDLNPVPHDLRPPYLATAINEGETEASFELVMSTVGYYGLGGDEARRIIRATVQAVSGWRRQAAKLRIHRKEVERMASAFEHKAARAAELEAAK